MNLRRSLLVLPLLLVSAAAQAQEAGIPPAFRRFDLDRDGVLSAAARATAAETLRAGAAGPGAGQVGAERPGSKGPDAAERTAPAGEVRRGADRDEASGPKVRLGKGAASSGPARAGSGAALPGGESLEELRERRAASVQRLVERQRDGLEARDERLAGMRVERQARLQERTVYEYVARFQSPAVKAPQRTFAPVNRQGISRGKKRGSAYYSQVIQRSMRGGGRGGRGGRGGGGLGGNF
jgi:hypothetical protein